MLNSFPKHHIASARKNDAASGAKAGALASLGLYAGWPKAWPLRLPGKPAERSVSLRKGRTGLDVRMHGRGAMPPSRLPQAHASAMRFKSDGPRQACGPKGDTMLKLTAKLSKGCLAALLALALGAGEALADVAVDAANFPDGNFRQWVKENAAKGGDVLTDAQIASVEEMDLSYGEMASLKGLERFTALKALTCLSNSLKTLDLPAGGAFESLIASGNELERLDLSKTPGLRELRLDQNSLKSLDLAGAPELAALSCRYNGLAALDLSHSPNLVELDCWGNELKALDLSKNKALEKLNCLENPIARLDLSKNPNLSEASLPASAQVVLPNGDTVAMADFQPAKAAGGKRRLDLAKFGAKIAAVTLEPEGEEEDRELKAAKGKYVFPSCDGKLRIAYRLGGDAQLEFVIYLEK